MTPARGAARASAWVRLREWAAEPVAAWPLGLFRIAVGGVLALESARLLWPGEGGSLLEASFLAPDVALPHPGFEWVVRLPDFATRVQVGAIGLAGTLLAGGVLSRFAAGFAAFAWTHLWLAEASLYNNHHYLTSLLLLLLAAFPLGAAASWPRGPATPETPRAALVAVRLQLALMYSFAGVAKFSQEWWNLGEPLRTHLGLTATAERLQAWLPEAAATWLQSEVGALFLSRGGALLDLLAGPLLLIPALRLPTAAALVGFHAANHFVLFDDIGLFPLLGVATLPVFFGPACWPAASTTRPGRAPLSGPLLAAALAFGIVQIALPLRHFAIPGPVAWTGEGQRFAWRMKAVSKRAGSLALEILDPVVTDTGPDGRPWFDPAAAPAWMARLTEHDPFAGEATLPDVFGVWTPRVGLRIVAPDRPSGAAERERVAANLEARLGAPARWRPSLEPAVALATILGSDDGAGTDGVEARLRSAIDAAEAAATRAERRRAGARIRTALARLAADGTRGDEVRAALARSEPWLFAGVWPAERGHLFLDVESGEFERLASALGPDAVFVDPDFEDAAAGLSGLPRSFALRRADGRLALRWNPVAELTPRQLAKATTEPDLLRGLCVHVAAEWEAETGRRPVVRARARAALVPYRLQDLVDPRADLAAAAEPGWTSAAWIRPLDRSPRR